MRQATVECGATTALNGVLLPDEDEGALAEALNLQHELRDALDAALNDGPSSLQSAGA